MLVVSVSAEHLELEYSWPADNIDIVRLANISGTELQGICKVSVIFVRNGLTAEELQRKVHLTPADGPADDPSLFDCADPDHF